MKSRHFRILAIFGIISILSVAFLQFFWFQQAYNFRKKEFEIKVFQALREVAEEVFTYNGTSDQEYFPVEQLSENYFVVMINDRIDLAFLESLLKRKFKAKYISTPYTYTIYDCANNNLVYGSAIQNEDIQAERLVLPKWDQDQYYFGVYFPNVTQSLLGGMKGWFVLSFVLILIVLFFAFALFIVFRQKRLSEIQRDFVNNMTHELKTPLSSIKLSSDALLLNDRLNEHDRKYIGIIRHEAEKLKRQIENVLEQARGKKDGLSLEPERVDIIEFLNTIIERFNFRSKKKISFNMDYHDKSVYLMLDKLHMEHVFQNLLDNTVKYGRDKPELIVKTRQTSKNLILTWQDNGPGIPKKYSKQIFSPFFRISHENRHDEKGFGLGLHYVKNVMLAHKGKISWEGQDESGHFEIKLPL